MRRRTGLPVRTSLIIASYNQPKSLALVLEALAAQTQPLDEIIIADDGSKRPTFEVIEQCQARLKLPIKAVITQEDLGFRKDIVLNKAVLQSTGQQLLFLDGDVIVPPYWVERHRQSYRPMGYTTGAYLRLTLDQSQEVIRKGLKGLNWRDYRPTNFHRKRYLKDKLGIFFSRTSKPSLTGGNFSVDRGLLFGVNGFDERYIGFGAGDADLRNRMNNYGGRPQSLIFRTLALHLHHDVEAGQPDPQTPKDHHPRVKNYKPRPLSVYRVSKKNVWAEIGLTSRMAADQSEGGADPRAVSGQ